MPTIANSPHVGIALALVVGAGAATALGASVVFIPSLVQYANRKTLASALGLSAGVMTYVSFVEIFRKAINSFRKDDIPDDDAYVYATLCFFGGVMLMLVLNYSVAKLVHGHRRRRNVPQGTVRTMRSAESASQVSKSDVETNCLEWNADLDDILFNCCSDYPIEGLETIKTMARELQEQKQQKQPELNESTSAPRSINDGCTDDGCNVDRNVDCSGEGDSLKREEDETKLMRTSINTAIAIGLHNFPEGLATFVAALHDPRVGAMLAIAIAIHNIPEGLCVALPIYYATGKRWKAFGLAVCSGLSEPAAALLGWAILANSMNNTTYGILFGLVGGMMVTISVRELLPTAHRYDPEDSVVTSSYIFGMCIMALSLVIFVL